VTQWQALDPSAKVKYENMFERDKISITLNWKNGTRKYSRVNIQQVFLDSDDAEIQNYSEHNPRKT